MKHMRTLRSNDGREVSLEPAMSEQFTFVIAEGFKNKYYWELLRIILTFLPESAGLLGSHLQPTRPVQWSEWY